MTVNKKLVIVIIATISISTVCIKHGRFNFVGYLYPHIVSKELPGITRIVYKPTWFYIAGILIFTDKSYYTLDAEKLNAFVHVKIKENGSWVPASEVVEIKLSDFPYKGYKRVMLPNTIQLNQLNEISFEIDTRQFLNNDNSFIIAEADLPITQKNEYPKIIYQFSIGELTKNARAKFWSDRPFAQIYTVVLATVLISCSTMAVLKNKQHR